MTDRDENFNRVLRRWQVGAPSSKLDRRVWDSVRAEQGALRTRRTRKWLPIAAALVLAAAAGSIISMHSGTSPRPANPVGETRDARIKTTAHAEGFVPLPDGLITVVTKEEKR